MFGVLVACCSFVVFGVLCLLMLFGLCWFVGVVCFACRLRGVCLFVLCCCLTWFVVLRILCLRIRACTA